MQGVLDAWSQSSVLDLEPMLGGNPSGGCATIPGFIHVCNGNYGQTSWNGKAQWSYIIDGEDHDGLTGSIINCVVQMNDHEYVYGEESKLMCHEIGHCLVSIPPKKIACLVLPLSYSHYFFI